MANKIIKKISDVKYKNVKIGQGVKKRAKKTRVNKSRKIDISSPKTINEEFREYKERIAAKITDELKKLEKENSKIEQKMEILEKKKQELEFKKKNIEPIISEVVEFQTDFESLISRLSDSEEELNHNLSLYKVRKAELEDEIKSLEGIYKKKNRVLESIENQLNKIRDLTKSSLETEPMDILSGNSENIEKKAYRVDDKSNKSNSGVKEETINSDNTVSEKGEDLTDLKKFSDDFEDLLKTPGEEKFFGKIEPKKDELEELFNEVSESNSEEKSRINLSDSNNDLKTSKTGETKEKSDISKSDISKSDVSNDAMDLLKKHNIKDYDVVETKPQKKSFFSRLFGKHHDDLDLLNDSKKSENNTLNNSLGDKTIKNTGTKKEVPVNAESNVKSNVKNIPQQKSPNQKSRDLDNELSQLLDKTKNLRNELSSLHSESEDVKSADSNKNVNSMAQGNKVETESKTKKEIEVCPVCGTPRKPGAKYCHVCGYKFE